MRASHADSGGSWQRPHDLLLAGCNAECNLTDAVEMRYILTLDREICHGEGQGIEWQLSLVWSLVGPLSPGLIGEWSQTR